jgi:DNA-binding NtrC family response regulator
MATSQPDVAPRAPLLGGESEAMRALLRRLGRVARSDAAVLLQGETGTGKSLAAREIHARSRRATGPFVAVDCAALAPSVIESELFGHERGAFTGAVARHRGRLERAAGGTLLLDEVAELPLALQAKLLAVLEERRFERVGGERALPFEGRVVAATHRRLADEVRAGRFRRDLYFRLRVVVLELPPLRERRGELFGLVWRHLPALADRLGVAVPRVTPSFLAALGSHDWPGNVRELLHVLERALVLCEDGQLGARDLEGAFADVGPGRGSAPRAAEAASGASAGAEGAAGEAGEIGRVLRETGGNVSRAARRLGLARSTLRYRIQRHGLGGLLPSD